MDVFEPRNLKSHHFLGIIVLVAMIFLLPGLLLFQTSRNNIEGVMTNQVGEENLVTARSGALVISDFLENTRTGLILLSKIESVKSLKEEGESELLFLVNQLKNKPLSDIVRVDKEGKVIWGFMANSQEVIEKGLDLSDRDYFIWAKQQKESETYISKPLLSRGGLKKGDMIIVIAVPVFYRNEFNGVIFASFPIEGLIKQYVKPLVVPSDLKLFILSDDGTIVASSDSRLIGENIIDRVQANERQEDKEKFIQMIKGIFSGEEGTAAHYYFPLNESRKKLTLITAYSPIVINGIHWSLWLSSPHSEVARLISPLKLNQARGMVLGLSAGVGLIFLLIFGFRVVQRDAFFDGLSDGMRGHKRIKNKR